MVDRKVRLEKYSGQIQSLNAEREELLERRGVEIFFSFDIVNSSAYKNWNLTI